MALQRVIVVFGNGICAAPDHKIELRRQRVRLPKPLRRDRQKRDGCHGDASRSWLRCRAICVLMGSG